MRPACRSPTDRVNKSGSACTHRPAREQNVDAEAQQLFGKNDDRKDLSRVDRQRRQRTGLHTDRLTLGDERYDDLAADN